MHTPIIETISTTIKAKFLPHLQKIPPKSDPIKATPGTNEVAIGIYWSFSSSDHPIWAYSLSAIVFSTENSYPKKNAPQAAFIAIIYM